MGILKGGYQGTTENNMTKDLKVLIKNDEDYSLIIKMLKFRYLRQ